MMPDCGHGWRDARDCDACMTERIVPGSFARIAVLEAALQEVRAAIIANATDTLWLNTQCPETIVDRIDAALNR